MLSLRRKRTTAFALMAMAVLAFCSARCGAQAALLLEQPYGFFGTLNPTGHNAVYLERVCAETPVMLRRCEPGELGVVISRYQGIDDYDWIAIPLVPYLYSVESLPDVPSHVDRAQVKQLRSRYFEAHLQGLGGNVSEGSLVHGGWTQLVGTAYERRIYAFRFDTSAEQDDALIARLNADKNHSHFDLFYNNCADFARGILNTYYPRTFNRSFFPDAGMTTPNQITYKLVRYARNHPEAELTIFEIPQIPGYRRNSRSNKSIAESLTTTGYAVPIVLLNPYIAGGIFIDYLVRGRFHPTPKHPQILRPDNLLALTAPSTAVENPSSAEAQAPSAASDEPMQSPTAPAAKASLKEAKETNE